MAQKLFYLFVFSAVGISKSQILYACSDLQINGDNSYALCRSIDGYFETTDLHSSLLSVAFLLMLLVFLDHLFGLVVKASASRAEGPGFESRLRRDFSGVESYQ